MRAACRIGVSESSGIGRGRKGSLYAENQIAESARRLADRTRLGLDAMFFGGSITHSHFIQHLGEGEWRELLRRADVLLPRRDCAKNDQVPPRLSRICFQVAC